MTKKHVLLQENSVGLILRVFASREEDAQKRIDQVMATIAKASELGVSKRIDILVVSDPNYPCDFGGTAKTIRCLLKDRSHSVHEVEYGDLFCGVLNYGIALQSRKGVDYSVIMSNDAHGYLTPETMDSVFTAAHDGCRVVGVAINELSKSIQQGRVANTFAMWHNVSLQSVRGFDIRSAHAKKGSNTPYLRGIDADGNEQFYPVHGVEEIIPLCYMVERWGKCIGVVLPGGDGVEHYIVPDPATDPEGYKRHLKKMGTKESRQTYFANSVGFDLSFIQGGVKKIYS